MPLSAAIQTSETRHRPQRLAAAVVQVHLEPETAQRLLSIMTSIGWQTESFVFDAYLAPERRPSIAPNLRSAATRLCFVDFDADPEAAAASTRQLRQLFQGQATVIALGRSRDPELLLLAMRAGCTEFLEKPVTEDRVLETLYRLESTLDPAAAEERHRGTVVSFFGVKGGVGATTAATHLAIYLVQVHHCKVLLIDNHRELGHVCVYLGIDGSQFPFDEVVRNVSRLDSELLKGYIARHRSGLDVLSSPDQCGTLAAPNAQAIAQTLDFLRGEYDFVLVDSAIANDDTTRALLNASTQVALFTTPEVGALRDLARYLDQFSAIEGIAPRLRCILNRYSANAPIGLEQIEAAIQRPIALKLPSSGQELVRTENLGQVLAPDTRSDYVARIRQWAEELTGTPSTPTATTSTAKPKKSLFSAWKTSP